VAKYFASLQRVNDINSVQRYEKSARLANIKNKTNMETYDIYFNDENNSNNKGWHASLDECKEYIKTYNGTNESYFADYKGGVVTIVCNETGDNVYFEDIK